MHSAVEKQKAALQKPAASILAEIGFPHDQRLSPTRSSVLISIQTLGNRNAHFPFRTLCVPKIPLQQQSPDVPLHQH